MQNKYFQKVSSQSFFVSVRIISLNNSTNLNKTFWDDFGPKNSKQEFRPKKWFWGDLKPLYCCNNMLISSRLVIENNSTKQKHTGVSCYCVIPYIFIGCIIEKASESRSTMLPVRSSQLNGHTLMSISRSNSNVPYLPTIVWVSKTYTSCKKIGPYVSIHFKTYKTSFQTHFGAFLPSKP